MMATAPAIRPNFDVGAIRRDFPILASEIHGRPLVYLDSGASAQKPRQVIEAMSRFMETDYANVHRGIHTLSQRATDQFEATRTRVASFLNVPEDGVVFTRGATEAINLVAQTWGRRCIGEGDEIVITELEHHANIVPWQMLAQEKGAVLRVAPVDENGEVSLEGFEALLGPRTKLAAFAHVSNVLGTILPVAEMTAAARRVGALVLIDGCQAVPHMAVDLKALDPDFYAFSSHKLYGPTGIGVLYGRPSVLADMPPWQGGGDMIDCVSFEGTTYKEPPFRFEAGTPPIVEAIGLTAAIDYVEAVGLEAIAAHDHDLVEYAHERLSAIDGLRIVGRARSKAAIVSFVIDGVHAHDVGTIIDREGIAIRVGHHCAEPLHHRLGLPSTARASFGLYNTRAEVDALADALGTVIEIFR